MWYFRLNAALALLPVVLALVAGARAGSGTAGALAATVLLSLAMAAFYWWIASLLERRRRLGAYLTLALTGLGVLGALGGDGGLFALVIPVLGLLVAFGAWRELEGEVQVAQRVAARRAAREAAPPA